MTKGPIKFYELKTHSKKGSSLDNTQTGHHHGSGLSITRQPCPKKYAALFYELEPYFTLWASCCIEKYFKLMFTMSKKSGPFLIDMHITCALHAHACTLSGPFLIDLHITCTLHALCWPLVTMQCYAILPPGGVMSCYVPLMFLWWQNIRR